jgi:putative aldouronate transport system substrate-binding protein
LNRRKTIFPAALSVVLVVSAVPGCSGDVSDSAGYEADPSAAPTGYKASAKPISLSFHVASVGAPLKDSLDVFVRAAELTNVNITGSHSSAVTDQKQLFDQMIASGKLDDIVSGEQTNFNKFGEEGIFVPLNELLKKYAPNITKFFEQRPDVRKFATSADGNIYFIPQIPDGELARGWFIRQDWLDKLGLRVPATVDEYYEALKAFRDNDPNGNGKADEIPFFTRDPSKIYDLLTLWDTDKNYLLRGGAIVYGPYEPAYKLAMSQVAKWYKEGLIDKEALTRGNKSRDILLGSNTGGSTHDWFASTATYNDLLKGKVPGLNFVSMPPPRSAKGVVAEYSARDTINKYGWGIAKSNKYVVETVKYFDFWFTDTGKRLANFGIEGKTYTIVNGKPTFTKEILESGAVNKKLTEIGAQLTIGYPQDFAYEEQWVTPIAAKGMNDYIASKYVIPQIPKLDYTLEEQKRLKDLEGPINGYVDEISQKWILGGESVDAGYGKYVDKLISMNIEEVLKIKNDAYQRYMRQ